MTCEMAQRAIALAAMASSEASDPDAFAEAPDGFSSPVSASVSESGPGPAASHGSSPVSVSAAATDRDILSLLRGHFPSEENALHPFASLHSEFDPKHFSFDALDSEDDDDLDESASSFRPGTSNRTQGGTGAAADSGKLFDTVLVAEQAPGAAGSRAPQHSGAVSDGSIEQDALAAHLNSCRSCQAEMAATTAFFRALANETGPEPSATLLARSRIQLDASLDSCEQAAVWTRLTQQFSYTAGRLRAAPVLCSGLLMVGLFAGGYAGVPRGSHRA